MGSLGRACFTRLVAAGTGEVLAPCEKKTYVLLVEKVRVLTVFCCTLTTRHALLIVSPQQVLASMAHPYNARLPLTGRGCSRLLSWRIQQQTPLRGRSSLRSPPTPCFLGTAYRLPLGRLAIDRPPRGTKSGYFGLGLMQDSVRYMYHSDIFFFYAPFVAEALRLNTPLRCLTDNAHVLRPPCTRHGILHFQQGNLSKDRSRRPAVPTPAVRTCWQSK